MLGRQFDDDLNVRAVPGHTEPGLPGYTLASFTASRSVGRNFDAFFGVQNMFDEEYFVGTLPTTMGRPGWSRAASGCDLPAARGRRLLRLCPRHYRDQENFESTQDLLVSCSPVESSWPAIGQLCGCWFAKAFQILEAPPVALGDILGKTS